jgi:hypothetical protein
MVLSSKVQIVSGLRSRPTLEIIPDTRFITFHGSEHEASPVKIAGRVRLTTTEATSIMKPKVWLQGKSKVRWYQSGSVSHSVVEEKLVFCQKTQNLGVETAHKINAGTMEWAFEFELPPSVPESVEGLRETYIVYHLHASVSRPGWNVKDILAQEHIRIVRTLGEASMETTRSRSNADIWPNKVAYNISIPTDAVIYGTSITADVELSPLKKGVRFGKVQLKLLETVVKRIRASDVPELRVDRSNSEEIEVARAEMDFPEASKVTYEDETVDEPTVADEMYRFKATLPLPGSLTLCRQDVDLFRLNVTHRFNLLVNIINPEGHTSQLVCRLPVKLFISPNLPIDETNRVQDHGNHASDLAINNAEMTVSAPPQYGRHYLDQIYSDVSLSGFVSRAASGPVTPAGVATLSRRASSENIVSISGMIDAQHGSAVPQLLHSRLTSLQESEGRHSQSWPLTGSSPPGAGNSHLADHSTPPSSASLLRQNPGLHQPTMIATTSSNSSSQIHSALRPDTNVTATGMIESDFDLDQLARVPSYNTALRTPGAVTPLSDCPPSYIIATSRTPSPPISAATTTATSSRDPSPAHHSYSQAVTPHDQMYSSGAAAAPATSQISSSRPSPVPSIQSAMSHETQSSSAAGISMSTEQAVPSQRMLRAGI